MQDEQSATEQAIDNQASPDQMANPSEAAKPKKPRKPRAPRKKKAALVDTAPAEAVPTESTPLPNAASPVIDTAQERQVTVSANAGHRAAVQPGTEPGQGDPVTPAQPIEEKLTTPAQPPTGQPTPVEVNGYVVERELEGAEPRKSGRRAWTINLGQGEHIWERVTTPDNQIVFRFKYEPTEAQMELIQRYGFRYDAPHKEAHRANDIAGRTYADKLAWYLREHERGRVATAARGA